MTTNKKSDKQIATERLIRSLHQLQLAIQIRELDYGAVPLVLACEHLLEEAIRIQQPDIPTGVYQEWDTK